MKLSLFIHHNQAFFTTPIDMINTIEQIFKTKSHIDVITNQLPIIATQFIVNKYLKDDMTLTNDLSEKLIFYQEVLSSIGMKKKKEALLYILCQNSLFGDTYMMVYELAISLK